MKKKFKILLATDYSGAVMNAERFAIQFVKETNSVFKMFHAYQIPVSYTPTKPIEYSKSSGDFYNAEFIILEQHSDKLLKALNIKKDELKCECSVREGRAGREIIEEAEQWNTDFIIVGTHGESGLRKVLLGSHAWDVIKKSNVPVFAIPIDGKYTGMKNIVFAAEGRVGEIKAINFLVQLAKEFNSEITVIHITNFAISKKFEIEKFEEFKKEVEDKISYKKLNLKLEHHQNIIEGLNNFCLKVKADLLVMSPTEHTLLEKLILLDYSFTKNMSFRTHLPLLCIPDYSNLTSGDFWELFELDEGYMNTEKKGKKVSV